MKKFLLSIMFLLINLTNFFIPAYNVKVLSGGSFSHSFMNICEGIPRYIELDLSLIRPISVLVLYFSSFLLLILALIFAINNKPRMFYIFTSCGLFFMFIAIIVFIIIIAPQDEYFKSTPSWSFYLSLLLLLAWIVYLLYPRFIKKHINAFKLKHTRKPTKSEQISDLQRQIDELKKTQDEFADITSDIEKGSD